MGYSYGTYHFYGVHVPREQYRTDHLYDETDRLTEVVATGPTLSGVRVGYVTAGEYDEYELFLCVVPTGFDREVPLGEWRKTGPETHAQDIQAWDDLLHTLATVAEYEGLSEPGWITAPFCV